MSETENKENTEVEELPQDEASESCEAKEEESGSEEKPAEEEQSEEQVNAALMKKIAAYQEQAASSKDDALRHRAELENFRKRMQREKDELRKVAAGMVIEDLLPVLDNLKLGLMSARQHPEAKVVVDGFDMVANQLQSVLGSHGLQELTPKGEAFDPNVHECISNQNSEEVPEDHICEVVRSGYKLNDRLLRPANVIVSSGSESKEAEKAEADDSKADTDEPGI